MTVQDAIRTAAREAAASANGRAGVQLRTAEAPRLYTYAEQLVQPPLDWLLRDYLTTAGLVTLTGKWGVGKSVLATGWAISVGTGRSWFGHDVQPGGVIYIAAEPCRPERLLAYQERWPPEMEPRVWFRRQALPLGQPAAIDALLRQVEELPNAPRLIVADTYARCAEGIDENDATATGVAVAASDRLIRETGATVLHLRHPGHATPDRGRGSSALDAAADTTLLLAESDGILTLKVTKQRDASPCDPLRLRLVPYGPSVVVELEDPSARDLTGAEATALESLRRIMVPGGITAKEWRLATGLAERTFYDARGRLVQRGDAVKDGSKYLIPGTATAGGLQ